MADLNKDSVYIRRNSTSAQEVSTDLIFAGNINIQAPTTNDSPATKKYVDDLKNTVITDVVNASPNALERITKERYRIDGYNSKNSNYVTIGAISDYPGVGRIIFKDKNGRPLVPCGWSWGENYNSTTGYGTYASNIMGVKQMYFTLQAGDDFEATGFGATRQCQYPLSADDLAYFQGLNKPVICINAEDQWNYHFGSGQNWYDWSAVFQAFKTFSNTLFYGSGQNTAGILWAYSSVANGNISFWIEEDQLNSLENFKNNVIGMTLGISSYSGGANGSPTSYYGCGAYSIMRIKNEKFTDMNVLIDGFTTTNLQAAVNLTLDENFNQTPWNANTLTSAGCSLLLKENVFKKVVYNATNKKYEVITV